jgi:signal transduction histidine kinase
VAIDDVVAAGLEAHALLRQRLAEKEAQRSRLLRALLTAQEEERSRISRDLHDQIGQALTAMLIGLDRNLERPTPTALGQLRSSPSLTLADVRRIALDLRPSVLDELGLEAAVERYARELHERYGARRRVW